MDTLRVVPRQGGGNNLYTRDGEPVAYCVPVRLTPMLAAAPAMLAALKALVSRTAATEIDAQFAAKAAIAAAEGR